MRLIYKTTIILLLMILITVMLVGETNFFLTRSLLQKNTSASQLNDVEHIMYNVDLILYERWLDMQSIAGTVPFINYLTGKENRQESYYRLNQYSDFTGPWLDLVLIDQNKNIKMRSFQQFEKQQVGVIDDEPELEKAFDQAYGGELYYSDLIMSSKYKKPVIVFAAPIRNYSQFGSQVVGVVVGQFLWEAVLENMELLEGDSTYSDKKIIQLYSKNGILLGGNSAEHNKGILIEDHSGDEVFKIAMANDRPQSVIEQGIHDKNTLSLMSFVKEKGYLNYRGNDWVMISELPAVTAFASATSSAWQVVLILLSLLIILILAFGLFINKIIINPINKLTNQANKIASGNLNSKIEIVSKDELGQLGSSFNIMTGKLRESYRGLEDKVKIRTEELSEKVKVIEEQNKKLSDKEDILLSLMGNLNEEKRKVETLINNLPLSVVMVGMPGSDLVLANVQAQEMFSQGIVFGRFDLAKCGFLQENGEAYAINDLPLSIVFAKKELSTKKGIFIKDKNGKKIALQMTATPIKNGSGEASLALAIIEDISVAYEIDKVKTEFVSIASHQLRTPISSINWYTEILLSGDAGKTTVKQKKFLQEIYEGGQRMTELVNSLLNVSRLELGVFAIDPKPANIINGLKSVLREMIPQIKNKELKIKKDFEKNLPLLNVDSGLMRIIFQNLLSNAVKYTPSKGKINLTIKQDQQRVLIVVADSGYGIPLAQQEKIFTKLFRADNIRDKDPNGTGLGLYIIKSILDQTGGKIWFESAENQGTTFYISLPLSGMSKREGKGLV